MAGEKTPERCSARSERRIALPKISAECLSTAMEALSKNGWKAHRAEAFRLITCVEMCRTSAHFILIGTPHHKHMCRKRAESCEKMAA
jgi:hypothetical protein